MGRTDPVIPDMHRGDVWWADVPGDKVRPVIVLTRERFIQRLTSVVVAPVTTRIRGIPTELTLGPEDGMPQECVANFDNLATLNRVRFRAPIASLPPRRLAEACAAYRFAAGW